MLFMSKTSEEKLIRQIAGFYKPDRFCSGSGIMPSSMNEMIPSRHPMNRMDDC